jgi:hypothetical protein
MFNIFQMFTRTSKYVRVLRELKDALREIKDARQDAREWKYTATHWNQKYETALRKHNALAARINAHGGEELFQGSNSQLSASDIAVLITLCHPDKHNGRESATRMTTLLLKMRK